jgi:hypothetical protein
MKSSEDPKFNKEMEKLADDEFAIRKEINSMKDDLKGVEEGLLEQAKAESKTPAKGDSKVKSTRRKVNFVEAAKRASKNKKDLANVEKQLTDINKRLSKELSTKGSGYKERIMALYKEEKELLKEVAEIKNSLESLKNAKKTLFRNGGIIKAGDGLRYGIQYQGSPQTYGHQSQTGSGTYGGIEDDLLDRMDFYRTNLSDWITKPLNETGGWTNSQNILGF